MNNNAGNIFDAHYKQLCSECEEWTAGACPECDVAVCDDCMDEHLEWVHGLDDDEDDA